MPDRRKEILTAAARLFAEKGFQATGVRDICRAAGANVAAVNYYFRSKEALYQEVFRYLFEALGRPFRELAERPLTTTPQWRGALREWIWSSLDILTDPRPPKSWAARLFARERAAPSPAFSILYEKFFEPIRATLEGIIRLAVARGRNSENEVSRWVVLLGGACTTLAYREPPWDRIILPAGVEREEWISGLTDHYLRVVCRCLPEEGSEIVARSARRKKTK